MKTSFSVGRWTLMTFLGWLVGVVLILVFSAFLFVSEVRPIQFYIGTGMAIGIGFFQWIYLKKHLNMSVLWWIATIIGITLPFVAFDFLLEPDSEYLLLLSTVCGSLLYSFLQFLLLRKHSTKAIWWIPITFVAWMAALGLIWLIDLMMLIRGTGIMLAVTAILNLVLILGGGVIVGLIQGKTLQWMLKKNIH